MDYGYKSSWSRGKQLCPVFTYKVGDKEYSEALNEAKGTKEKSGDVLERGFTLKLPRKIIYNPQTQGILSAGLRILFA